MGLIDGTTRDECQALEDQLQSYAENEEWIQAWNINGQGLVPPHYNLMLLTHRVPVSVNYKLGEVLFVCIYSMPGQFATSSIMMPSIKPIY